ncbi:hypothetical protein ABIE85_008095 [Bradyrhizobium diazoefficiens]|uniref:Uncharacterized protein n=1 Tax=Bradyrhizobium japonicum TaxID=375 RepID=A0ABV2S681_BRAJP|nr:hypothetical protein [Bradyrhizobium japonicum]MBP1090127.1 hypothetical protein [Bradyrhizobium japonicum]MCP1759497.1 hypothetical protein [Bradyrhizobium japonicum]MCP1791089.1 hypothetical protein [Bradyrhizobium japonicum]MCP1803506.1 hypothetical protein [Bradyrhizobium japonicum]
MVAAVMAPTPGIVVNRRMSFVVLGLRDDCALEPLDLVG